MSDDILQQVAVSSMVGFMAAWRMWLPPLRKRLSERWSKGAAYIRRSLL